MFQNHFIYAVVIPGGIKFTDDVCIDTICARGIGIAEVEKYKDFGTDFGITDLTWAGILGLGFSESAKGQRLIVYKNIFSNFTLCKNFS